MSTHLHSKLGLWLFNILTFLVTGAAIWSSLQLPTFGLALVFLIALFVVVQTATPKVRSCALSFAALVSILIPLTTLATSLSETALLLIRLVPPFLLVIAYLSRDRSATIGSDTSRRVLPLFLPIVAYAAWTTVPHGQWNDAAVFLLGGFLYLVTFRLWSRLSQGLKPALVGVLFSAVAISLLLATVAPSLAVEGARVRGVFENANGFGFICFIAGSLALLGRLRRMPAVVLFALSLTGIALAASRASLLALGIVFVLHFLKRRPLSSILSGLVLALVAESGYFLFDNAFLNEGVLRTNNSRADGLDVAISDAQTSFWIGVGMNNESSIIASTPLRALSNGGLIGLFIVIALYASVLWMVTARYKRVLPFVLAAIVHSLFEGWFLSTLSPLLLLFAAAWLALAAPAKITTLGTAVSLTTKR